MYYVIMIIGLILLLSLYFKTKSYEDYQSHCIDDLEKTVRDLRKENDLLKGIANEQNESMNNLIAGRTEEAFVGFQNVKDEIERLANEKEPNNNDEV